MPAPNFSVRFYRNLSSTVHSTASGSTATGFIRVPAQADLRWVQVSYEEPNPDQPVVIIAHELQIHPKKRNP